MQSASAVRPISAYLNCGMAPGSGVAAASRLRPLRAATRLRVGGGPEGAPAALAEADCDGDCQQRASQGEERCWPDVLDEEAGDEHRHREYADGGEQQHGHELAEQRRRRPPLEG